MSLTEVMPVTEEQDRDFIGDEDHQVIEAEIGESVLSRSVIIIYGGGANTEHFGPAIDALGEDHDVYITEVREPSRPFPCAQILRVDTEEGRDRLAQLYESPEGVHAAYGSLLPGMHMEFLKTQLRYIGEGKLDIAVISKPTVQSSREMREIDAARVKAEAELLRRFGPEYVAQNPVMSRMHTHEHYLGKGAWKALQEKLGHVAERLGRLRSVEFNIEEAQTAEDEGRVGAFGGGLLDLSPHLISMGLDVQSAINTTDRYTIPDHSRTSVERFRYEGSELPEGVETGFIIRGNTTVIDHNRDDEGHDLQFTWTGGKGLTSKKEAVLEFVHPDTGEVTTIRVDLRSNTLEVPDSVRDLFPRTEFDDNGYGPSVKYGLDGLNGGNPNESFQSWPDARVVIKWSDVLMRHGQVEAPRVYARSNIGNVSVQELSQGLREQNAVVAEQTVDPESITFWRRVASFSRRMFSADRDPRAIAVEAAHDRILQKQHVRHM